MFLKSVSRNANSVGLKSPRYKNKMLTLTHLQPDESMTHFERILNGDSVPKWSTCPEKLPCLFNCIVMDTSG